MYPQIDGGLVFYLILVATVKIMLLIFSGAYLSKKKILTPSTRRAVIKVSEQLLQPCVLFSNFVEDLNVSDLGSWVPSLTIILVLTIIGIYMGYFVNWMFIKDPENSGFIAACCAFTAIIQVPLILILTLSDLLYAISAGTSNSPEEAAKKGMKYLMISMLVTSIMKWLAGRMIMMRDNEKQEEQGNNKKVQLGFVEKFVKDVRELMSPPLTMGFLSFAICCFPPVQAIFKNEDSIVHDLITEPAKLCAKALSPIMMVQLGGSLVEQTKSSDTTISSKAFTVIAISKLIGLPIISTILIMIYNSMGWIQDPIVGFVLYCCAMSPTAVSMIATATLKKDPSKTIAQMTLLQYTMALFTMPFFLFVFFSFYTKE